ncbi:MAG: hypothetical protein HY716_04290 [Planctomycetes bacterium]|nr:hypothetical protein [Planctomycetota bacterium]
MIAFHDPASASRRVLALFAVALLVPACGGGDSAPANLPPSIVVEPLTGVQSGLIEITYSLSDPESDSVSLTVERSVDGGATFAPASVGPGGDGNSGLASSPTGVDHVLVWDSVADQVALAGPVTSVVIRLTPRGISQGASVPTNQFTVDNPVTAFRIVSLALRDPHVFAELPVYGCSDLTDSAPPGTGVTPINQAFEEAITGDEDGDGYLDLSILVLFNPLDPQSARGTLYFVMGGRCPAAGGPCGPNPGTPSIPVGYANGGGDPCLEPLTGTVSSANYSPAIGTPASPCFVTDEAEIDLAIPGWTPVPLQAVRAGATYSGDPPATLTNGLLRGFLSESVAGSVMVPTPGGSLPLSTFLPGGQNNCASHDDRDVGPDGVTSGWWIYFNFTAERVDYGTP